MPSKSKAQQKLFGMALAVRRGELSRSEVNQDIDRLYISEEMGVAKPDPAYFAKVCADIGEPDLSKYLVIGDSLSSDIDGAAACGMDSVWFAVSDSDAKGRKPTYTIHMLTELLSIL